MFQLPVCFAMIAGSNILCGDGDLFDRNLYLVRAHVVQIKRESGKAVAATCEIEHVYFGPSSIRGQKFHVPSLPVWMRNPEIAIKDVGIWWIAESGDNCQNATGPKSDSRGLIAEICCKRPKNDRILSFLAFDPSIKRANSDYDEIEKWATSIERDCRSDAHTRVIILKEFCCVGDNYLFLWASFRLERILAKTELIRFYKDCLKSKCLIRNEVLIDLSLCEISPNWIRSDERKKLIRHWMIDKLADPKNQEYDILGFIELHELPLNNTIDLLLDGLCTKNRSDDFKSTLISRFRSLHINNTKAIDAGFDYLLLQLKEGRIDRRLQAAKMISGFAPLTKNQQASIEELIINETRSELAKHLRSELSETTSFWGFFSAERTDVFPTSNLWKFLKDVFHPDKIFGREFEPDPLILSLFATQLTRGIQERLRVSHKVDTSRFRQFLLDLDNEQFSRREKAQQEIISLGLTVEPMLLQESKRADSAEFKHRINDILTQFKIERRFALRAIKILAIIHTPEARRILVQLAEGAPDLDVTRDAKIALEKQQKDNP